MSKSSINFQTAKSNSSKHMSRDSFVSYLIEHDNNHFEYKHYQSPKEYLEFALVQTKLLTNRKMQSKAIENFTQEAVLNIKKDTTIQEVENLFKTYNKEFKGGFKVFEIALHKDEGVFIDTKHNVEDLTFDSKTLRIYKDGIDVSDEVISLAPNKDIFYNPDNQKWYKEKTFENEFDTSKLQKKMNLHAHISFTKWDELTGKNIRLQKSDLQNIQTITAREMKMERGEENSQTKRLNHYQIKKLQSEVNEQKLEHHELKLVTVPQLKAEIAILRAELKENKATRADYAELEQLNKELKAKVESKDLTIQELQEKIASLSLREKATKEYSTALLEILPTAQKPAEVVQYVQELKKDLSQALQSKNELQAVNHTLRVEKMDFRATESNLNAQVQELKNQNEELKSNSKNSQIYKSALMKIAPEAKSARETVEYVESLKQENKSLLEKIEPLIKFFEKINKSFTQELKAKFAQVFPTLYPKPTLESALEKVQKELDKLNGLNGGIDIYEAQAKAQEQTKQKGPELIR